MRGPYWSSARLELLQNVLSGAVLALFAAQVVNDVHEQRVRACVKPLVLRDDVREIVGLKVNLFHWPTLYHLCLVRARCGARFAEMLQYVA